MFDFKKNSGFLAGAFAFAAIFWITGFILYTLLTAVRSMGAHAAESGQNMEQRYAQQLSETERQLAVVEEQQKRSHALLSRQEAQADRFDAVLAKWEQQAARGTGQ